MFRMTKDRSDPAEEADKTNEGTKGQESVVKGKKENDMS